MRRRPRVTTADSLARVNRLNAGNVRLIGDFFFHRAENLLQHVEPGGGDISTIQALVLMASREVIAYSCVMLTSVDLPQ